MPGGLDPRSRLELARLKRELPAAVARDALQELKQAAKVTADETKARILAAAAPKYPARGLRAEIAATVRARSRVTATDAYVAVESLGRRMPAGKANLPAYADGTVRDYGRWRHPVFGPTDRNPDPKWVTQEWPSAHAWFYGAWDQRRFIRAAEQGMSRAARDGGR
jgi:hypothetical protein